MNLANDIRDLGFVLMTKTQFALFVCLQQQNNSVSVQYFTCLDRENEIRIYT